MRRILPILLGLALAIPADRATAVTNIFSCVADTSLLEISPTNNLGGFAGMNSGTTQEYKKTRALLRFDLSGLPTNALILSTRLQLEVTRQPDEPPNNTTFGLHRMLRPWGEGTKAPLTQPGKGLPATPGEATWECAFHPTNTWSIPGGAPDVDFSSVESASQFIYGTGESPYGFETTPELVADVITWVHNPAANFGWMLLCNDEFSNFTARRFGSREDPNTPPLLEFQYLIPPALQLTKTNATQVQLQFIAWADHHYDVLYRNSLSPGPWFSLTNLTAAPTNYAALVTDSVSSTQRFYRVSAY